MTERLEIGHDQEPLLTVTQNAQQRISSLMEAEGRQGQAIRVVVRNSSPGRFQYGLEFVEQGKEDQDDTVVDFGPFRLVVDSTSAPKLKGATIDFVDDPLGGSTGLQVDNPNSAWTDPMAAKIQELIDTQINPGVASHGGHVDLIDVKENVVYILLGGGCQGCGMVDVTLKQGIEVMIKEAVPEIQGVVDTTDHAGGSNPYYQPAKGGESPGESPLASS
jgi:Fe/S biogenesis protein NfuA